jgi:hypothetical protein
MPLATKRTKPEADEILVYWDPFVDTELARARREER